MVESPKKLKKDYKQSYSCNPRPVIKKVRKSRQVPKTRSKTVSGAKPSQSYITNETYYVTEYYDDTDTVIEYDTCWKDVYDCFVKTSTGETYYYAQAREAKEPVPAAWEKIKEIS